MQTIVGVSAVTCGLFLFLWYRILVSLPQAGRPSFVCRAAFHWGVPVLSLIILLYGFRLLAEVRVSLAAAVFVAAALAVFALVHFDRYTAQMRIIYDRYRSIRASDPRRDETAVLYLTARWRYPDWQHDRLVELVGGKDIEALILVMLVQENRIHPIIDWELYRVLKKRTARITGKSPREDEAV